MDYSKINASIVIQNGQIIVNGMFLEETKVTDEHDQLFAIREIACETIRNFERGFQKQFIPNKNTEYILPKEEE